MKTIGISIYPAHSDLKQDKAYLKKAASYGYKRLFMCLLSETDDLTAIISKYQDICSFAHQYGFEISVDTNFDVFQKLGATPKNLKIFKDIGFDIIRLDGPFTDFDYVAMTKNPYHLKIEFNGSSYQNLDFLLVLGANKDNMVVCANFYPQKYTGLAFDQYLEYAKTYKPYGYRNAAFVSSNNQKTFGPWPVYDGLVTIESCRGLDIVDQARMLLASTVVDDIIIGNAYASDKELEALSTLNLEYQTYKYQDYDISKDELAVLDNANHYRRLDCGDYLVRSISARGLNIKIAPRNHLQDIKVGDLMIVNANSLHYQGEVQIALKDFKNDGTRNVVGHLDDYEMSLIKYLKDNHKFILMRK